MAAILIDTNVLVYTHDRGEHLKQQQANRILDALFTSGAGILSAQTLAEFFRAVTRGTRPILPIEQAYTQVQDLSQAWDVLDVTPSIVLEAARGVRDHQLAYWDAQIWATAKLNQIAAIFTEDFPSAEFIEGVQFVNPFGSDFALEEWL